MNLIEYYCPKCKAKQVYYSNPYYMHICSECKAQYTRNDLLVEVIDIDQLLEDFQNCYESLSEKTYNQIVYLLQKAKDNI